MGYPKAPVKPSHTSLQEDRCGIKGNFKGNMKGPKK